MVKILITGSEGYLGSYMMHHYRQNWHDVIGIDIKSGVDYMSPEFEEYLEGVDVVIHLAAIVGDPACAKDPKKAIDVNFHGLWNLVRQCNKRNILLVFASTCSIYGFNKTECDEKSENNPLSLYAWTKLLAEGTIKHDCNKYLIFRFGTLYGQSPQMRDDIIVNRLVNDAMTKHSIAIFGGNQIRPFIHLQDVCDAIERAIGFFFINEKNDTYILASENLSIYKLGELVRMATNARVELINDKEDDRSYACSASKAKRFLGFKPEWTVLAGILEMRDARG